MEKSITKETLAKIDIDKVSNEIKMSIWNIIFIMYT